VTGCSSLTAKSTPGPSLAELTIISIQIGEEEGRKAKKHDLSIIYISFLLTVGIEKAYI
jgi:hypothetical protein